jgi:subtilisin family serine protease
MIRFERMTFSATAVRLPALALILCLLGCKDHLPKPPQTPPPPPTQPTPPEVPAPKPKITKLDDLPRHTYPVQGSVVDLVTSKEKFDPFAADVRANVEKDLATYDIEDKTTLKRLKGTLLALDLITGRNDEARALITELRGLEDKPALKLTSGFLAETRLDVMDQTHQTDITQPDFQKPFEAELGKRAAALPWNIVQDELKHTKAGYEIRSTNLLLGEIKSEIDPAVQKTGSLSNDLADAVIGIRASLEFAIPLKAPVVAALGSVIQAHNVAKTDIWKDRSVMLTKADKAKPVVIGIWDSGVDPKVYPKQLFTVTPPNPVDPHGLAFDLHSNPVHGELYPMGDNARRLPELKSQIKGLLDLQAAIDSPDATALRARMSGLSQEEVKPFLEDLSLFGNYIHGTHVAGIASEGNPFARLLIARITFDYHLIPEKPTVEQAKKDAAAYQAAVDYFKQHNVRVVNMSWGGSLKDVDDALEKNGVGDAEERKKEAREIFDIGKNGLYEALKSAPDILFVTAAGNSNNDVNFDEVIPSSFVLPNLMTVGAVDIAGEETSFTSFGSNVTAYADGFEVESHIPGGSELKLSGTSMASPNVANLAAKLFALDPALKPGDVIDLIKGGLDVAQTDKRILLINPRKTVEQLKARPDFKS